MLCPECKTEYRPGVVSCSNCGVRLVPENEEDLEPVTVFVSSDPSEAHLIKSLLEGSGLDVLAFDDHFSSIDSRLSWAIGGVKIAVPKFQEQLAIEALQEYRGGAGQDPGYGRITPFSLIESEEDPEENVAEPSMEYRCIACKALLAPETTVCPQCKSDQFPPQ